MPLDFEVGAWKLKEVNSSSGIDGHHERDIVVWEAILSTFFMVQGLESLVEGFLLGGHRVNGEELLNLTLVFVKVHNDGLVVSLANDVQECVVLWQDDAINATHCIGHVVKELTPHPIALWTNCVNVAVLVLCWREITRLSCPTDIDVVRLGVNVERGNGLFFEATRENWELLIVARGIF